MEWSQVWSNWPSAWHLVTSMSRSVQETWERQIGWLGSPGRLTGIHQSSGWTTSPIIWQTTAASLMVQPCFGKADHINSLNQLTIALHNWPLLHNFDVVVLVVSKTEWINLTSAINPSKNLTFQKKQLFHAAVIQGSASCGENCSFLFWPTLGIFFI